MQKCSVFVFTTVNNSSEYDTLGAIPLGGTKTCPVGWLKTVSTGNFNESTACKEGHYLLRKNI